jgi:O-antigen/teichoic acid export membrane protein
LQVNNFDAHCCKQLLRFGGGIFGGSLINIIYHSLNKVLLSRYAGVSTISVYEIAFNGSMQIRGLLEAGLRAMLPEISRISGNITESRRGRIIHLNRLAMKFILVIGVPVYGALIWFSTTLLKVWIGDKYVEALRDVFPLMLVVSLVSLFAVPAYYTLMGIGRVLPCFLSQVISMCVHVVIILAILVLTSTLRVEYVAYATFGGMSAATSYLFWQSQRSYASMVVKDEDVVVQGSVNMI